MSEKQLLYWIGKGSVMHDGKPLDKNVPLPLEKLTKEFIEKHTKLGNIGEKIVSREALTNAELERIARETQIRFDDKPRPPVTGCRGLLFCVETPRF